MVAVTFIFALNLFGAFELFCLPPPPDGSPQQAEPTDGQLLRRRVCHAACHAVFCAVPRYGRGLCAGRTAAFLWLIFLMLGVGMSLPWLFVALIPKTALLLPKPSPLDEYPEGDSGGMMLASSLWLVTLLSLHLGEMFSHILMLLLIVVAIVVYALRGQTSSPLFWVVVIALAVFGAISCAG